MLSAIRLLVFYVLPRPLGRGLVATLTFLGMLLKKQILGPRNVQISIPSGCDHNCQFCISDIHGTGSPQNRKTLHFDEICSLIDSALSLCSLNLNFVSTGEPALYPKLKELIDYVWKESRGRANIKIVTNGTSLTKFSPEDFGKKNVFLWLSLHAGDKEIWKSIHRPLANTDEKFEGLKKWLQTFNKVSPSRVTLHNVISTLNAHHLDSVLRFARETHTSNVFFGRLYKFPELQLNADQEKLVLKSLEDLAPEFERSGIKTNISNFKFVALTHKDDTSDSTESEDSKTLSSTDFYRHNNCYISWLFSSVDDTGNILSCGGGKHFGNTRKDSYASVFRANCESFLQETTSIKRRGTNVSGCRCEECPHIQMNAEANHYVKKLKLHV